MTDGNIKLLNEDVEAGLQSLKDNSVDSIVTDPPYGIKFMNKKWDYQIPTVKVWQECKRVLKPGGHILVACGTRTHHRMTGADTPGGLPMRHRPRTPG